MTVTFCAARSVATLSTPGVASSTRRTAPSQPAHAMETRRSTVVWGLGEGMEVGKTSARAARYAAASRARQRTGILGGSVVQGRGERRTKAERKRAQTEKRIRRHFTKHSFFRAISFPTGATMRAIVQRVTSASVEVCVAPDCGCMGVALDSATRRSPPHHHHHTQVDATIVSSIGRGLLVLVGITHDDTAADVDYIARKLLSTRLWPDATGRGWCHAPADVPPEAAGVAAAGTKPGVDLLFVSQFTLYGSVRKGTKPDFSGAAPPDSARSTYAALLDRVREAYEPERVKDGVFGAMMKVRMGCCLRSLSVFLFCFSTTLPANPAGGSRQRWPRHPHPGLEGRQDASLQSIEQTERESDFLCYIVSNTFFSPRQQHAVQRLPARHGQQLVSGPTRQATTCRQEFHQHG